MSVVHQINLSTGLGGGEVYTIFFSRALQALGRETVLYVHREAPFWRRANLAGVRLEPVASRAELLARLPRDPGLVVTQTSVFPGALSEIAARHLLTGFAHMPMWGRSVEGFRDYRLVLAVSRHVIDSLRAGGFERVYAEPMYGVVDFDRGDGADPDAEIAARPVYVVDRRKFRDRLLGLAQPLLRFAGGRRRYEKRPGLTLGIVSLLAPIKQFPELLSVIAPIIAEQPQVNLEIFGYGGYAYVRDMRRALAPLRGRVRFWGAQPHPEAVYPRIDWLLAGLPEKEALGLNVLEAQSCGTPVLAVGAPPFTETVLDGRGGLLYGDPRQDGGSDFRRALAAALRGPRPDPRLAREHMAKFSFAAFVQRVERFLAAAPA